MSAELGEREVARREERATGRGRGGSLGGRLWQSGTHLVGAAVLGAVHLKLHHRDLAGGRRRVGSIARHDESVEPSANLRQNVALVRATSGVVHLHNCRSCNWVQRGEGVATERASAGVSSITTSSSAFSINALINTLNAPSSTAANFFKW